ncbi:DUF2750 domain-containing protein [Ethanoligenens sp.]|uniref:DUF2750 domain-containing protein n=1 Tax=Ethanoligenens sp. TaxID=2099655 RepID=UPI0039EC06C0
MNQQEIEAVLKTPAQKRYEYFIKKVSDYQEVYGLLNKDGWVEVSDDNGITLIPFWPHKEYAELCATGVWSDCHPELVHLNAFIDKWLPGMKKDHIMPCVFLTPSDQGVVVSCEKLIDDLAEELGNY